MNRAGNLALAAILAVVIGCTSGDDEPEATGTDNGEDVSRLAAATPESPRVISGGGQVSTDPFQLEGGRYTVHYKLGSDCYYGADLEPVNGELGQGLASGDGPVEGDTNIYEIKAGEYYVQMITGPDPNCPWEITLTAG